MFADDHKNKIADPNNGESEKEAEQCRYDLTFGKSRNNAAEPCRKRNDREDNAYEVNESEIVALSCHDTFSPY